MIPIKLKFSGAIVLATLLAWTGTGFAHDVNFKNHRIYEEQVRSLVGRDLGAELEALDVGGGTLRITAPGRVYGLRSIECTLIPSGDPYRHVAKGCRNSFGGHGARSVEGAVFRVTRGSLGQLLFSQFEIYREARGVLKGERLKDVEVFPAPVPIAVLRVRDEGGVDKRMRCRVDFVRDRLTVEPCWTEAF